MDREQVEANLAVLLVAERALDLPETQRFWKQYPRMRILPEQEVAVNGRSAYLTTFESLTHTVHLDILSDAETLAILDIHETGNH